MAMLFSDYSLKPKLNINIDGLLYFMESFDFMDAECLGEKRVIYDRGYAFTGVHRVNGFADALALGYAGAVDLSILDSDYYASNGFSTGIDLNSLNEQEGGVIHEDFLYGVYNQYRDKIQQHSQMLIHVEVVPMKFMSIFMKIITQESELGEYDNEKILDKLIAKILFKTEGDTDFEDEIVLKYKFDNYRGSFPSVYPILVELQKNGHVDITGVDYIEGYLYFHISKIGDIDGIDRRKILESIGTKKNIDLDLNFDGIHVGNKRLSPNLRLLAEYIFIKNAGVKKVSWGDANIYIYGNDIEGDGLINTIKKLNKTLKDEGYNLGLSYERDSYIFIKELI